MTANADMPALGYEHVLVLLTQLTLLLACALVLGRVARRLAMPAVVGELLTGVLLGPSVLAGAAPAFASRVLPTGPGSTTLLDAVALLGILLLVGVTGLHLDLRAVRRRRATVLRVSGCGLVVPLALGVAAGFLLPAALLADRAARPTFAAFLGVAMSVSAIPVIAKMLSDMRLLHRDVGQLTLAAAVVDDAVGWCLLSAVSALAISGFAPLGIVTSLLHLAAFLVAAVVVGRPAVAWVMRRAAAADAAAMTAAAVVVVLAGAAASHALDLEAVFGAFVAGALVGAAPVATAEPLAPLRTVTLSVLAPISFATAGLRVDLRLLADPLVLGTGLAVLAVAVAGKFAGAYAGARLSALSHWEGLALGAGLNARGVIEIVVASVGLRLGILTTATYTIVVLVAVATSLMAPPILRVAMRHIEHTAEERLREAAFATPAAHEPADRRAGGRGAVAIHALAGEP